VSGSGLERTRQKLSERERSGEQACKKMMKQGSSKEWGS